MIFSNCDKMFIFNVLAMCPLFILSCICYQYVTSTKFEQIVLKYNNFTIHFYITNKKIFYRGSYQKIITKLFWSCDPTNVTPLSLCIRNVQLFFSLSNISLKNLNVFNNIVTLLPSQLRMLKAF